MKRMAAACTAPAAPDITQLDQSAGLTPGSAGVYQISVVVPASAPTGNSVPVTVTVAGQTSNVVTMAVQ